MSLLCVSHAVRTSHYIFLFAARPHTHGALCVRGHMLEAAELYIAAAAFAAVSIHAHTLRTRIDEAMDSGGRSAYRGACACPFSAPLVRAMRSRRIALCENPFAR